MGELTPVQAFKYDALALDIAMYDEGKWDMERDDAELRLAHGGMSEREFKRVLASEGFKEKVLGYREGIQKDGLSFAVKANAMAEEVLSMAYDIVRDPNVVASTRLAAGARIVAWAGISAEAQKAANVGTLAGSSIQIFLVPPAADKVRKNPHATIEGEVVGGDR